MSAAPDSELEPALDVAILKRHRPLQAGGPVIFAHADGSLAGQPTEFNRAGRDYWMPCLKRGMTPGNAIPDKREGRNAIFAAALLALLALLTAALPACALDFPALSGRVVDDAGILDSATRAALTDKLADLETKSTDQLVVVTLKSLQGTSIEDFGTGSAGTGGSDRRARTTACC